MAQHPFYTREERNVSFPGPTWRKTGLGPGRKAGGARRLSPSFRLPFPDRQGRVLGGDQRDAEEKARRGGRNGRQGKGGTRRDGEKMKARGGERGGKERGRREEGGREGGGRRPEGLVQAQPHEVSTSHCQMGPSPSLLLRIPSLLKGTQVGCGARNSPSNCCLGPNPGSCLLHTAVPPPVWLP